MNRLNLTEPDKVAITLALDQAGVAAGQDDHWMTDTDHTDLPDNVDMRSRDVVAYYQDENDVWQPSALKANDDVIIFNGNMPGRVVGPGQGRNYFSVWVELSDDSYMGNYYDHIPMNIPLDWVGDRAPADPNETPAMPLIPEPAMSALVARKLAALETK